MAVLFVSATSSFVLAEEANTTAPAAAPAKVEKKVAKKKVKKAKKVKKVVAPADTTAPAAK